MALSLSLTLIRDDFNLSSTSRDALDAETAFIHASSAEAR